MKKTLKNQGGFTLIELMIVVAIIGILAAVAIPQYMNFTKKSKSSEAKVIVAGFVTAEAAYFAEQNTFTEDEINNLGDPASSAKYYAYSATINADTSVTVTATPNGTGTDAGLVNNWSIRYWGITGQKSETYPAQGW
jgi:type IV pilus assembly protein PilA